jgi:predicted PurR-regulated permease PerM
MAFVITVVVQVPLVVVPVVLAIVLAATFLPILNGLIQRGWGRNRAALAITAGAFLIITGILAATIFVLVEQLQPIVAQAATGASKIADTGGGALGGVDSTTDEATGALVKAAASVAASTASFVVIVVLATLLTFYFLRDGGRVWGTLMTRLAPWRRTDVDAAGTRAAGVLGGYMIGTGAISLFGAATQFLIMAVLGLPLALPLAVLSFFGGFIPYIGSFITTGIAFLVTVAVGSPQDIAIMAIFTIVFNIVTGNVVAPIVYGRAVNLHPAIVLMAIPAGAALAGIAGMFLVVPFVGVVAATWRTVLRVFGDEPHVADALAPPPELAAPHADLPASVADPAT